MYKRQGDDYDVWCENVEVCHRRINGYIAESKGNATYFSFEQGFIGDFDIILRINLNGRQPRWQVTVILDRGPALQFNEIWVNCGQAVDFLPDATCGPNFMGAPRLDRVGARWTSQLVFGERLPMEGEYYGVVAGTVFPAGQPMAMIPRLESMHFTCPASPAGCAFPLPRSYQDTGSLANPRN